MIAPRPDEQAAMARSQRAKKASDVVNTGFKTALGVGAASLSNKVMPWLSELIPEDLAIKGLSKIHPKIGKYLQAGISAGLDPKEGLEYIKQGIEKEEQGAQQPTQQSKNIIEQYSPELHQYILQEVQRGQTPLAAATKATLDNALGKKFKEVLEKISKQHKTPWHNIIESIYGGGQPQQSQQQSTQPQPSPQMQTAPGQQSGQGLQAYIDVLGKIKNSLGA